MTDHINDAALWLTQFTIITWVAHITLFLYTPFCNLHAITEVIKLFTHRPTGVHETRGATECYTGFYVLNIRLPKGNSIQFLEQAT